MINLHYVNLKIFLFCFLYQYGKPLFTYKEIYIVDGSISSIMTKYRDGYIYIQRKIYCKEKEWMDVRRFIARYRK